MVINYCLSNKSVEEINDFFTKSYDFKQWFFKLKTLEAILENTDKFFEEFADDELKEEGLDSYKIKLKAESVFTFFHMAEALFSLMYCAKKTKVPWLFMKNLKFKNLCNFVREEIISGEIDDDDIRFLFFNGVIGKEAKKTIIVDSIKFIKEFLKRMGKLFLDNEVYTEYKHGLRVMTTNSFVNIIPENVKNAKPLLSLSGTAHVYLTTKLMKKEGKEEFHKVSHKTTGFDYELYLRLCIYIYKLMNSMFKTRQQKEKLKSGDKMLIQIFSKDKIEDVFKEDPTKKFSFTIHYN
ncbi:MAG: hypothetical protein ABH849_02970 [Nanoarchaeota archaeon]